MKLNTIASIVGAASLLVLLMGCGSGDQGSTASGTTGTASPTAKVGGKAIKITLIAKSSTNPMFLSAKTGAEAAAKDLSTKTGREITIDWQTPPTEDGQVQAQKIAEAVNSGSDGIILSCSDAAKVNGAIDDAVAKGIPVMTFDSDAPDSKRFAFYGADNKDCGVQVMEQLAKITGGKGNVAILAGNQNAPNLKLRVDGVTETAKKYPGIKIVGVFHHAETPNDAAAEVQKEMKAYPEITAWAMIGGWPLFTTTLLNDLDPAKVKVVAVDALPQELPYVQKGIAPVLLAQQTYQWGYVSTETLVDKIANGKDPATPIMKMDLVPVTKETLTEWVGKLKGWGFEDADKYLTK